MSNGNNTGSQNSGGGSNYGYDQNEFLVSSGYQFTQTTRRQLARNSRPQNQQNGNTQQTGNISITNERNQVGGDEEINRNYQETMDRDYGRGSLTCVLLETTRPRVLNETQRIKIDEEKARMKGHYPNHVIQVPKEISLDPHLVEIRATPRSRITIDNDNDDEEEEEEDDMSDEEVSQRRSRPSRPRTMHSRNTGSQVVTRIFNLGSGETNDVTYDTDSLVYPNLLSDPKTVTKMRKKEKCFGKLKDDGVFGTDAFQEKYENSPYLSLFELFFGSVSVEREEDSEEEGGGSGGGGEQEEDGEDYDDGENERDAEDADMEELTPGEKLLDHFWEETNLHAHFRIVKKTELENIAKYHSHVRVMRRKKRFEKKNEAITRYFMDEEIDDGDIEDTASPENNPDLDIQLLNDDENEDLNDVDRDEGEEEEQEFDGQEQEEEDDDNDNDRLEDEDEEELDQFSHYILSDDLAEEYRELSKITKFRNWAKDWKENHEERIPHEYYTKEIIQRYIICVMLIGLQRGDTSSDRIWTSIQPSDLVFALMSRDDYNEITRNFHFSYCEVRDWVEISMPQFYIPGCYFTVDESICAYNGRCKYKVKIKGKPRSKGIKSMSLNDSKGFAMKFVVYHGKEDENDDEFEKAKKDFQHNGEGVVRRCLINTVTGEKEEFIGEESILFVDRWFGNMDTLDTVATLKIPCVMTVNKKSKRGRDIFDALETQTKDEESIHLSCAPVSNQDYLFTSYNDSSLCRILSYRVKDTLVNKRSKFNVEKTLPLVSAMYNDGMQGTDQMNRYLYSYQNERKFRRCTMKLAYFLLAMLNTNLFLLHKTKEGEDHDSLYWFLFNMGQEYVQHVCNQRNTDYPQATMCIRAHEHLQVHFNKDGGKCTLCGTYVSPNHVMATCSHRRCRNVLGVRFCLRSNCHKIYHQLGFHLY